jgi:hypothetical protein
VDSPGRGRVVLSILRGMTDDEMRLYLDHLAQLPDGPDLPEEDEDGDAEEPVAADRAAGRVQVAVVSSPPGRLRRVHTKGLWFAGLPELFIDPPANFGFGQENEDDWARLAFLLASALITLGQDLIEAEHFDLEPHHDVFRGRPVRIWLARHEAPDDELRAALGPSVDTVIRVECSLWAEEEPARILTGAGA